MRISASAGRRAEFKKAGRHRVNVGTSAACPVGCPTYMILKIQTVFQERRAWSAAGDHGLQRLKHRGKLKTNGGVVSGWAVYTGSTHSIS